MKWVVDLMFGRERETEGERNTRYDTRRKVKYDRTDL